ncbi:MAG: hypothetical protein H7Y02_07440 [Candidatus Obscuribacterales bacterium]|nr:hypothetical protein [Steroidobacteraceae bacterium]
MSKRSYFLWLALFATTTQVVAQSTRTTYSDPIRLNAYVNEPRAAIVEGIRRFQWVVQDEQPGKLVVRLDRPAVHVLNAIYYDKQQIRFEDISALSYDCSNTTISRQNRRSKRERASDDEDEDEDQRPSPTRTTQISPAGKTCEVDESQLLRWRINLRRGVVKQIQELAIEDALEKFRSPSTPIRSQPLKTANNTEQALYATLAVSDSPPLSLWAVRSISAFYPSDEVLCDILAEQLLQAHKQRNLSDAQVSTLAWQAKVLGETRNPRYRNALTESLRIHTSSRVVQSIELALQIMPPATQSEAAVSYSAGQVNLIDKRAALQRALANTRSDNKVLASIPPGAGIAVILEKLGPPDDFSQSIFDVSKYGLEPQLTLHYADAGLITLKYLPGDERHWIVTEVAKELVRVRTLYAGKNFAIAQALASWRGIALRDYVAFQEDDIESDSALEGVLENRLLTLPTPIDIYEDRGLSNALELVFKDKAASSIDRLRNIAANNNGADVKEAVADLIWKTERGPRKGKQRRSRKTENGAKVDTEGLRE